MLDGRFIDGLDGKDCFLGVAKTNSPILRIILDVKL
jgi:hypothetical protein